MVFKFFLYIFFFILKCGWLLLKSKVFLFIVLNDIYLRVEYMKIRNLLVDEVYNYRKEMYLEVLGR